ncbi:hypothetical protein [Mesoplasma lactucae]|uniref:Uncharacterized protein n=1 Tax=Mesoplasma lactucae ATCC 49193 TaxID=81460 RepID=A0A291IRP5_9MOLU|nr:hypothetical protein [Mesoplasma lactucae]ATG97367.1 hypothetical protein CP520_01165 [Mesoplasma lactucae ATCC 49193]ATZ20181.1 hypothetical protein MLACT_v1c03600 [Mesoplasma lactucae ATCC 49193]MCL8216930.1 hypothetical protein [Mesoplasma lactucae ATCC 49193]
MIEIIKQNQKEIDVKNLNYINSWFDKAIIKNQKDLMKYLKRFNWESKITNNLMKSKDQIDYNAFIRNANISFQLLVAKEEGMEANMKVIRKFRKMINEFGEQSALVSLLEIINEYFNEINEKEIWDRQKLVVSLVNKTILKLYQAFQKMYLHNMEHDPDLKSKVEQVFENDRVYYDKVFDPIPSLKILFKFASLAFRSKKISQEQFNEIYFNTLFANSYWVNLSFYSQNFVNSIRNYN